MKVVIGSDHAGFVLKTKVKEWLEKWGHEVIDVGAHSADSVDYPDFGAAVGRKVIELGPEARGVAVCGSGIGISIAANKIAGVRAALVHDVTGARLSRMHNDANVICFGERQIGAQNAEDALHAFLGTAFEGGRHAKRVEKLTALD
jgi:ribose 5-phosphate isomerase B